MKKLLLICFIMIAARMWALLEFADRWMARDCGYCSEPLAYVVGWYGEKQTHYEFLGDLK